MGVIKKFIIVGLLLVTAGLHASGDQVGELRPLGEGLPLPWPFPWAKECPVDWNAMNGRYALADSKSVQYIDLKISVITGEGFKLVRVARYDQSGKLQAEGFTYVSEAQKTLALALEPSDKSQGEQWAVIELYYESPEEVCTPDHLVPILTLADTRSADHNVMSYKMIKLGDATTRP